MEKQFYNRVGDNFFNKQEIEMKKKKKVNLMEKYLNAPETNKLLVNN